jgi:hypothetical protein
MTTIMKLASSFFKKTDKNNFTSFFKRPKKVKHFNINSSDVSISSKIAIIIQGPILDNSNFIYETIKIYKKTFPKSLIILSTWDDEIEKLKEIKKLRIKLIVSSKKKEYRPDVDYQIITTNKALNFAKQKKILFSLKTRTDTRIYKNNLSSFFINLIKCFPIDKKIKSKGRIIVTDVMTPKYRVYGLSDICMFGYTSDLLKYFSENLFYESLKKYNFGSYPSMIKGNPVICEIFLCARYLKIINHKLKWDMTDWYNVIKKYFLVIDSSSINFFWHKYDWHYENKDFNFYKKKDTRLMSFTDWVSIYCNKSSFFKFRKDYREKWKIVNGLYKRYTLL